ncbi:hypothetical protein LCGC14_2191030 [marine sediment metagenome]|uniref:Uncharacterized protein n=1 Tax=marine sediment metagenome TaxID=412755 RepID=A0A0F9DJL4_9ZZZZ
MPEIKAGEKIPGTYCPLCGEIGLRRMNFKGIAWAVCPMNEGAPVVSKLKDAHTAYIVDPARLQAPELDDQDSVAELGSPTAAAEAERSRSRITRGR